MSVYQYLDSAREQISRGAVFSETLPTDELAIHRLLNSNSSSETATGLRAVLTLIANGKDAHTFFGDIVKNVHSSDLQIREMTACYLIMYAQHEPELTLLMVNSVKRMLADGSPVSRQQALHLMSALRVPTVVPIMRHFLAEVMHDTSPLVRVACCQAIGKCFELDPAASSDMPSLITQFLSLPKQRKQDFRVAGWGLATLATHWPQRLDVLHPLFRTYVPHLGEFDEFCVVPVVHMVVQYCRHYMTGPQTADCRLFVNRLAPLLSARNSAVVIESAAAVHYVGKLADFERLRVVPKLLSLERTPLVWTNILALCRLRNSILEHPENKEHHENEFSQYRSRIILDLMPSDLPEVRHLAVSTARCSGHQPLTTAEFDHLKMCAQYWQNDPESVRATLETVCALCDDFKRAPQVLNWLVKLSVGPASSAVLVSESLMALRVFVQQAATDNTGFGNDTLDGVASTLADLAAPSNTECSVLPAAKATIIWLISTRCARQPAVATELLRRLLPGMANEPAEVRLQIVQLAAKLLTSFRNDSSAFDERIPAFFDYAVQLARYDPEIDIRDRARLFAVLLSNSDNSMASLLLQATQPRPNTDAERTSDGLMINSASTFFGRAMDGHSPLEGWSAEDTDALRDVEEEHQLDTPIASSLSSTSTAQSYRKPARTNNNKMSFEEFLQSGSKPKSSGETENETTESESESE